MKGQLTMSRPLPSSNWDFVKYCPKSKLLFESSITNRINFFYLNSSLNIFNTHCSCNSIKIHIIPNFVLISGSKHIYIISYCSKYPSVVENVVTLCKLPLIVHFLFLCKQMTGVRLPSINFWEP